MSPTRRVSCLCVGKTRLNVFKNNFCRHLKRRHFQLRSNDGNILAIGAYDNDGNGTNSGHVRVYSWNGNAYTQRGYDIDGEAAGDKSGVSVSLSNDGNILAIGAYANDGNAVDSGHVRVYTIFPKYIETNFTALPDGASLAGSATLNSFGECQLTPNINNRAGRLLFSSRSPVLTAFNAQWDYRAYGGTGADGTSFNFGPMTDSASMDEFGMSGAILVVSLVEWQGERLELRYNGSLLQRVYLPSLSLVGDSLKRVVVDVSSTGSISISVNGNVWISNNLAGYGTAAKTGWRFGFAARTGAINNFHCIDNLVISAR